MQKKSKCFEFFESIKFSHSIFALPFALIATFLAGDKTWPVTANVTAIIIAMIGARTWAMSVNRLVDINIDRQNPRTKDRALPANRLSEREMFGFGLVGAIIFIAAAGFLSTLAFYFSVPVLLFLGAYSYSKRFTFFCHLWLGIALGMAPLGAWIALTNTINISIVALSVGVCFWVSGFDIIYSLQDLEFDRSQKLNSVPAKYGSKFSMFIARWAHFIAAILFLAAGYLFRLNLWYFIGCFVAILFMIYEHWIIRTGDLRKINMAFFNLNGWIAVILFVATLFS